MRELLAIIFCIVIGSSYAQSLPRPIKSQIALGSGADTESIVSAVVIKHIPNTDKIVAVWNIRNSNTNSSWAYVRGVVATTAGDVIKKLDISTDSTIGFLFFTSPLLVALPDQGFAVFYYSGLPGTYYYMRRYTSDLNPVSDPVLVKINYRCIQPSAVIDTNGDIIIACGRYAQNIFLFYRLNATGHVLDQLSYPVSNQNVHSSIALNGDTFAVSMSRVYSLSMSDVREYIIVIDKDLNVLWEFAPFVNATIVLATSTSGVVGEPGNFMTVSMAMDAQTADFSLHAVKYNSTSIIAQHNVGFVGMTFLQALTTSFNDQGVGLLFCSTTSPYEYLTFPMAQTPGSDQLFIINQTDFDAVHTITAAEQAIDTYPYADVVQSATTWSTGGAVAWPEISETSGTHYARLTVRL